jgi:tetratricopeptide (TPR) repeat protein
MTASTSPVLERAERFLASGNWPQAEAVLRGAVEQHPADEKITLAWCNVLLTYGDVREGRGILKNLEAAGGGHPLVPFCLALGYQSDGDFAAARGILEKLRATHPHWTQATHLLVRMLVLEDKHTEAAAIIEPLLPAGDPLVVCGFGLIAPRVGRTEEAIERLRNVCENPDISAGIRNEAGLLLARLLDAEGQYDRALEAASRAHALTPSHYDRGAVEKLIESRVRDSSAHRIESNACADGDTSRPIFILGMPRSGTSLTEAILGEHSQIGPLGECRIIERFVPMDLADGPLVTKTSAQVLTVYRQLDGEHQRVTDKQLGNFLHLDAIASLLPGAQVIWCRRDVRDVAISCFFQQFQTGAPWAGNIEHILHYEQLYSRLMQHWEQVLSLPILQLEYEQLVAEPREQVSRMLDFLGLPWEEQCLKFDDSSRTTLTASNQQVKKKVYRSSVGRWQHYAQLFSEAEN